MTTLTRLHIGEVAELLGITPKTMRHYHRLGLLAEPERQANGYRMYTVSDLHRLRLILRLSTMGLSLKQIAFIFSADDADALLADLLRHRAASIQDEIARLQRQQAQIDAFVDAKLPLAIWAEGEAPVSAMTIMRDAIAPISSGLADILVAVETAPLATLDRYASGAGYDAFWAETAALLVQRLRPHEHTFILWLERYRALAALEPGDQQAHAWFDELARSPARHVLVQTVNLPEVETLPLFEQARVRRLLPLLLFSDATPLQQEFIRVLTGDATADAG